PVQCAEHFCTSGQNLPAITPLPGLKLHKRKCLTSALLVLVCLLGSNWPTLVLPGLSATATKAGTAHPGDAMFKPNRGRKRRGLLLEILEDRTLPNSAPVLTLPATSFTVVKTATLTVVASATDKDSGEILNFTLAGAPAGVSISSKQVASSKGSAATGTL